MIITTNLRWVKKQVALLSVPKQCTMALRLYAIIVRKNGQRAIYEGIFTGADSMFLKIQVAERSRLSAVVD